MLALIHLCVIVSTWADPPTATPPAPAELFGVLGALPKQVLPLAAEYRMYYRRVASTNPQAMLAEIRTAPETVIYQGYWAGDGVRSYWEIHQPARQAASTTSTEILGVYWTDGEHWTHYESSKNRAIITERYPPLYIAFPERYVLGEMGLTWSEIGSGSGGAVVIDDERWGRAGLFRLEFVKPSTRPIERYMITADRDHGYIPKRVYLIVDDVIVVDYETVSFLEIKPGVWWPKVSRILSCNGKPYGHFPTTESYFEYEIELLQHNTDVEHVRGVLSTAPMAGTVVVNSFSKTEALQGNPTEGLHSWLGGNNEPIAHRWYWERKFGGGEPTAGANGDFSKLECGAVALSGMLYDAGVPEHTIERIQARCAAKGKSGISASSLIEYANEVGIRLVAVRLDNPTAPPGVKSFIAVEEQPDENHYVYVRRHSHETGTLFDYPRMKKDWGPRSPIRDWNGVVIGFAGDIDHSRPVMRWIGIGLLAAAGATMLLRRMAGSRQQVIHASLSILLVTTSLGCGDSSQSGKEQEVRVTPSIVDFGRVQTAKQITSKVRLENRTSECVIVRRIEASCACTVADLALNGQVEPGVDLSFSVNLMISDFGVQSSTIRIMLEGADSGNEYSTTVEVRGFGTNRVVANPPRLVLNKGQIPASRTVSIFIHGSSSPLASVEVHASKDSGVAFEEVGRSTTSSEGGGPVHKIECAVLAESIERIQDNPYLAVIVVSDDVESPIRVPVVLRDLDSDTGVRRAR